MGNGKLAMFKSCTSCVSAIEIVCLTNSKFMDVEELLPANAKILAIVSEKLCFGENIPNTLDLRVFCLILRIETSELTVAQVYRREGCVRHKSPNVNYKIGNGKCEIENYSVLDTDY